LRLKHAGGMTCGAEGSLFVAFLLLGCGQALQLLICCVHYLGHLFQNTLRYLVADIFPCSSILKKVRWTIHLIYTFGQGAQLVHTVVDAFRLKGAHHRVESARMYSFC